MREGIVVTGTEVLTGRVSDRNGPWIADRLLGLGVDVGRVVVVGDRPADLLAALGQLAADHDLLATTGGLGPTADDLTAAVVAEHQGRAMVLDEALRSRITAIVDGVVAQRRRRPDPGALAAGTHKQQPARLSAARRRQLPRRHPGRPGRQLGGGYGAVYSHDLFRQYFPTGRSYVIHDSGPLLAGDNIPAAQRTAWYANWGLGWLDALCATCRSDMSQLHAALATRYPADRTALISSVRDQTIASYLMLTPANLETAVRALAAAFPRSASAAPSCSQATRTPRWATPATSPRATASP